MADNTSVANKMLDEYQIKQPVLKIPDSSPEWVFEMFPALLQSVYDGFNGVLRKVIADFNASFTEMQKQIDELSQLTKAATQAMDTLKDFLINSQDEQISNIKNIINKNESYSRRGNLIFGGISMGVEGTCTTIVHVIMKSHFGINDPPAEIQFVRCHYLRSPTADAKGTIIARFESYGQRMKIWNMRRKLLHTQFFIAEDFPSDVNKRRNKLRPILKEASKHRQYEKCISIKYDQLFFDGNLYGINSLHSLPSTIHPRTLSEKRSKGILCFGGVLSEYHEFSNYFKCAFMFKNIRFSSIEQAYQYSKAVQFGDTRTAYLILHCQCPSEIKILGRSVAGFNATQWNTGRETLMKKLVLEKFSQNPELKQRLCDTGTMHLAEATKSDNFFGIGVSITHPTCLQRNTWTGSNKLGVALMDATSKLRR